jgi:hypothetical protein
MAESPPKPAGVRAFPPQVAQGRRCWRRRADSRHGRCFRLHAARRGPGLGGTFAFRNFASLDNLRLLGNAMVSKDDLPLLLQNLQGRRCLVSFIPGNSTQTPCLSNRHTCSTTDAGMGSVTYSRLPHALVLSKVRSGHTSDYKGGFGRHAVLVLRLGYRLGWCFWVILLDGNR